MWLFKVYKAVPIHPISFNLAITKNLSIIMRISLRLVFGLILMLSLQMSLVKAQNWTSAHGNATSNTLNDVQFVTDQVVYAVGNSGTIIKSTDGGESWSDISYGDTRNFLSLYFFDETTGFVGGPFNTGGGGSSEMLAKTTDGGDTWEVFSSFDFDDFNDMEFISEQNGWVASADGKVLHTDDGGVNWSSRSAGSEDLLDIHIKNDSTYWAAGEFGSLYSSVDSGETWNLAVDIDTLGLMSFSDHFYGVEFLNEDIGFAVGQTYSSGDIAFVLKTTDGGENWSRVTTNEFEYVVRDIEIGQNGDIVLTGGRTDFNETDGNAIYISEDEGATWNVITDSGGPLQWKAVDYVGNQWIAVGNTGAITLFNPASESLDGGVVTGLDIADIAFFDDNNGILATGGRVQGSLFTTSDGGESWQESLKLEGRKDFSSVSFANENIAWAVGTDHFTGGSRWHIYYSSDAGSSWSRVETGFPDFEKTDELQHVQFINSQTGFIKAEDKLIKSTDGGASWVELEIAGNYSAGDFKSFQFIDENTGWLFGNDEIAATTDGGSSWNIQYEQDSQSSDINAIFFVDAATGYAAMDRGNMMKTTDGGESWTDLSTFNNFDLLDLEFVTADSGFVAGRSGTVLTTTDGGDTFSSVFLEITNQDIFSIDMLNSKQGWMAGENGFFVSTANGGGIATSIEGNGPTAQTVPSEIKLSQNYPNPFNPSTTITYAVPVRSNVSLRVFNMLGQNVATLVNNESKSAGQHSIRFDAGNLASGIYLYRLTVGGHTLSRQLTLIK